MTWGTDKELHRYPKGFKKKLTEYYGFNKPMCVICWSQTKVAIHHHIDVVRAIITEEKALSKHQHHRAVRRYRLLLPDGGQRQGRAVL